MSLAEAKLARQNKRIEQAEAALNAPLPLERDRQTARVKGKTVWKPFDFTADTTAATQASEANIPATEVRINTFRAAPTRDSSLSRSMSSLSQRTTGTMRSDIERQDSTTLDANGFQVYTGRKNRRVAEQLNAYEDKPEQKQTTVEAQVDKREIYEVFGNALPSTDFINENPGTKDGQLQFVQHPNGDVSAHQWSTDRFLWENIGQFSNIRKKIEGQLAADRLKGETAYQTLQQNTLAYFRTVARQREASAMGLPFGAKEIQAAMPDLRQMQPASTAAKKSGATAEVAVPSMPHNEQEHADDQARDDTGVPSQPTPAQPFSYEGYTGYNSAGYSAYPDYGGNSSRLGYPYGHPYYATTAPRVDHYNNSFFNGSTSANMQDPFYTQQSYRNIYGALPAAFGGQSARTPAYGSSGGFGEKVPGLNYDYHFPPAGVRGKHSRPAESSAPGEPGEPGGLYRHGAQEPAFNDPCKLGSRFFAREQSAGLEHTNDRALERTAHQLYREDRDDSASSKPVAPLSVRTSMRHQLFKISDQAKERSLSQTNVRTVLNDPFRNYAGSTAEPPSNDEPAKLDRSPELKRTVANPSGLPPRMAPATAQPAAAARTFVPAVGATRLTPAGSTENVKNYSSPDTYWSKRGTDVSPYASSASRQREEVTPEKAMGETLEDMLGYFEAKAKAKNEEALSTGKKTWDQQLDDWWKNGNTFARHEDLFNSIKAANAPPPTLAPIGTPAKKTTDPTSATTPAPTKGDAHTRLLIPVLENLASYVQGPVEQRRDYFSRWTQPPEWAIDRNDNTSFYDKGAWEPPARVGRDPRYRPLPAETLASHEPEAGRYGVEKVRFGAFGSPTASAGSSLAVGAGLERRFAFGRM